MQVIDGALVLTALEELSCWLKSQVTVAVWAAAYGNGDSSDCVLA